MKIFVDRVLIFYEGNAWLFIVFIAQTSINRRVGVSMSNYWQLGVRTRALNKTTTHTVTAQLNKKQLRYISLKIGDLR
jgi:hypothetical protein